MTTIEKIDAVPSVSNPVEGEDYNVVQGTPLLGDPVRIMTSSGSVIFEGCYTPAQAPSPISKALPKLDFLRHAATQFGSGGRVVEIEEAFAAHASADIRYAHKEYAATDNFTKEKVKDFLDAGEAAGILTDVENAAVIDNWPES